jgi:hypothetical protein
MRRCPDEKPHKIQLSRIALRFLLEVAHRQCNAQSACGEHRAHTAFMMACRQVAMKSGYSEAGVAVVTRP